MLFSFYLYVASRFVLQNFDMKSWVKCNSEPIWALKPGIGGHVGPRVRRLSGNYFRPCISLN